MKVKKEALKKSDIFKDKRDIDIIVLKHDDITVSLTQGKIILWFGRQANESSIRDIIFGISSIDSSITPEQEIICEFENISEYENMGYVLTSYAKYKGKHRVVFRIPFSRKPALSNYVRLIVDQLRKKDVRKTLHWDGSPEKIVFLCKKIEKLDGWEIDKIEFKEKQVLL